MLKHLVRETETMERVLIFVNNKRIVDLVFETLDEEFSEQFGVIHSNKSQNYRLNTMASFQAGELRGLVTTDIMARGLDISDITHVINLQFTDEPEKYMHRIGRTGRADKTGIAISLVSPSEAESKIEVELLMNTEIKEFPLPEDLKIEERYLDFEKEKKKMKFLLKTPKKEGGEAFHKKKDKNAKVNLGGPGKRKPRKTESRNRNIERKRDEKRKKK
jgi:ATP-dependent RNA helicase RhlE